MPNIKGVRVLRMLPLLLALLCPRADAHVVWTRANAADPAIAGLYHLDDEGLSTGESLRSAAGIPPDRALAVGSAAQAGMRSVDDAPYPFLLPRALELFSAQLAENPVALEGLDGDLTIEFWFKRDAAETSQSLRIGLSSGAKLALARDTLNPANDFLGLVFTHGDTASAPGFPGWAAIGEEEAPFGEWLHLAVTIHSTGMHLDMPSGHDVYNDGSTAVFWLNGHAVGAAPHTAGIGGKRVHAASKLRIQNMGGSIRIDEVAIWTKDWSDNGAAVNPFANGRGAGLPNAARNWNRYERAR